MISRYLLLNQAFCQAHAGYKRDELQFFYRVTLAGDYVAAEQTLYDFPELFENDIYLSGIPIIELAIEDFPVQNPHP